MTIDTNTLILVGVAAYFTIGALIAVPVTMLSMGFAGRFEPMAILLFFAWPVMLALQIPGLLYVLGGIGSVALMTWLAWLLLRA